jgi:hypothetical protein
VIGRPRRILLATKQGKENRKSSRIKQRIGNYGVFDELSIYFLIGEAAGDLFKTEDGLEPDRAVFLRKPSEKRIHRRCE